MDKSDGSPLILISPLPPPRGGMATWTQTVLRLGFTQKRTIRLINTQLPPNRAIFSRMQFSFAELKRFAQITLSLAKTVWQEPNSIVHLNCALSPFGVIRDLCCAVITSIANAPLVTHFHGNVADFPFGRFGKFNGFCLKLLMKLSKQIIVINDTSLQMLYSLGIDHHKISTLPNFLAPNIFSYYGTKQPHGPLQIIFAGGITKAKGAHGLLALAKALPELQFHLYGKLHADVLSDFAFTPKNIFLYGEVSPQKLWQAMSQSYLLLFPSHSEGFPMTVLEAMALGLPIVATSVGAIPEMVDAEAGGMLTPINDIAAMKAAIQRLVAAPALAKTMGEFNHQRARSRYDYNVVIPQLEAIYHRCKEEILKCVE